MKYFFPPYTPNNISKRYRELCKTLHPDKGGSNEEFTEMKKEMDLALQIGDTIPPEGRKMFSGKRVKMIRKKHSRVPRTKIVFNLDPDKLVKAFKKYFPK